MTFFSQKITLFLVLGLLVIAVSLVYTIYYRRHDVTGIGRGITLIIVLATLVVIILDRITVRFVAPRWLSAAEGLLLVAALAYSMYFLRRIKLDLSANPAPYFVIIWTHGPSVTPLFQPRFPFGKRAVVSTGSVAQLDEPMFSRLDVQVPTHWGSQFSRGMKVTHPRFTSAYFYGPEKYLHQAAEVDSLVQAAVDKESAR